MLILLIKLCALAGVATPQTFGNSQVPLNNQVCTDPAQSNQPQWLYHAAARFVPVPPVDPAIKRGFLGLFHRDLNTNHTHGSPFDPTSPEASQPSPIDPSIIAEINSLCSRSSFFYSFAPRHMRAIMLLQQQFMAQPTAERVLQLARAELYRHEINSRVWYYALLSTLLMRPDLNGYYLAWALDATPDLYIPAEVLNRATVGSTRPPPTPPMNECAANARGRNLNPEFAEQPDQLLYPDASLIRHIVTLILRNKRSSNSSLFSASETKERTKRQLNTYYFTQQQQQPFPTSRRADQNQNARQSNQRDCHLFEGTRGATSEGENQLWYFREDMMVNQHHWYWHQYFPQNATRVPDRRGEVFYFTHHNLIARYNAERLSNGLDRVVSLDLRLDGNIGEGYNPDLVDRQSGRVWTPRPINTLLSNINHQMDPDFQLNVTMDEISNVYNTLLSHIGQGYLLANRSLQQGQPPTVFPIDIRNQEGFNHLGNTVEADESLSTHPDLYHAFGVHNLGHVAIALSTDPDYGGRCPTGVMADLTVTMRDPAFYKIHSLVDDIFDNHKSTLPPYHPTEGELPLVWDGVQIQSLEVVPALSRSNSIRTFWSVTRFPLDEGIDGTIHDGDIETDICHRHLNHEPFMFRLVVDVNNCAQTVSNRGTVRIFMAPRFDVNGRRFAMSDTRRLMFQLDSFTVELNRGRNTITRNSRDSSSTKPWSRSLIDLLRDPDNGGQTEYCGCGWPRHLYVPKGTPQGMEFDVFAMITNFDQDQVQDTPENLRIPEPCNSPFLFCGIPYRRYPDARPLGYPFDRLQYSVIEEGGRGRVRPVNTLEEYVSLVPNSRTSVVVIQHLDTLVR